MRWDISLPFCITWLLIKDLISHPKRGIHGFSHKAFSGLTTNPMMRSSQSEPIRTWHPQHSVTASERGPHSELQHRGCSSVEQPSHKYAPCPQNSWVAKGGTPLVTTLSRQCFSVLAPVVCAGNMGPETGIRRMPPNWEQ